MNVGENICRIRSDRGMDQGTLAERAGVSQSMISQIERGTKACSIPLGLKIAEALGCDLNDLIGAGRKGA